MRNKIILISKSISYEFIMDHETPSCIIVSPIAEWEQGW